MSFFDNSFESYFALQISDRHRLIKKQQRQVSKVLLDGLYDSDSPISKLLGVRTEVVGEMIWQRLIENWQIYEMNEEERIASLVAGDDWCFPIFPLPLLPCCIFSPAH